MGSRESFRGSMWVFGQEHYPRPIITGIRRAERKGFNAGANNYPKWDALSQDSSRSIAENWI